MGGKVSFPKIPLSKDKVVIVTGGNTGIGYEIAKWIAMLGATVIIACRTEDKALEAINRMKTDFKTEKKKGTEGVTQTAELSVEYMHLDLTSLQSTKNFAEQFKFSGRKLNVFVCNAGIAYVPLDYTEDGNEMMFQVHSKPKCENPNDKEYLELKYRKFQKQNAKYRVLWQSPFK